jgi:hypothetical protein
MLQRCNEELLYLKALWDMAGAVSMAKHSLVRPLFLMHTSFDTKCVMPSLMLKNLLSAHS